MALNNLLQVLPSVELLEHINEQGIYRVEPETMGCWLLSPLIVNRGQLNLARIIHDIMSTEGMMSYQSAYEFLLEIYAEYALEELPLRRVRGEMLLGLLGAIGPSDWVPVAQGVFTWLVFKRSQQIRVGALLRWFRSFDFYNEEHIQSIPIVDIVRDNVFPILHY